MDDGASKIDLGLDLTLRVKAFAYEWSETLERLAEFDRAGVSHDAGDILTRFQTAVASRAKSMV